jgi:class 3 adenylate cyclase
LGLTRDDVEDTDYQAVTIDGADDEGTLARLKTLKKTVVDAAIAAHRGRIVTTTGDGILVEFASVVDAATGAAELPARVAVRNTNVTGGQATFASEY